MTTGLLTSRLWLRGRFASLDTAATARGMTAVEEDGEEQATVDRCRSGQDRRAISVPLTPVKTGLSRSLTDSPPRRSGHTEARTTQLPKLIVRVRFPSPALLRYYLIDNFSIFCSTTCRLMPSTGRRSAHSNVLPIQPSSSNTIMIVRRAGRTPFVYPKCAPPLS